MGGDGRAYARCQHHQHELAAERWIDLGDGGHDNDVTINLVLGEAQRLTRLDLRLVHRLDAGADDLRRIGGKIDRHADQRRRIRPDAKAETRQAEIDDEQLHEERRVADDFDISIHDDADDATIDGAQ